MAYGLSQLARVYGLGLPQNRDLKDIQRLYGYHGDSHLDPIRVASRNIHMHAA